MQRRIGAAVLAGVIAGVGFGVMMQMMTAPTPDGREVPMITMVGQIVAAICCATPILVVLLGAVGLSTWVGWLDYVLIPALVVFLGITTYALRRRRVEAACCTAPGQAVASMAGERR